MADLISLLTFPKTSNGFTALRSASEVVDDGFRNKGKNVEQNGPFKMEIRGFAPARIPESVFNAEVTLLNRFIETALGNSDIKYLPASYETIYCACRSLICAAHRGEALYGFTKIQLEKCTSRIARELEQNRDRGVDWIDQFVQACSWFEKQVALLQSLLTYLDQAYVLKTPTLSTTRYGPWVISPRTFNPCYLFEVSSHTHFLSEVSSKTR
ncbi:hypothetical protein SERLA73DRAFT_188823 [Serpula lacrymans var. lacrymans S7.3]|uniref:Cullin N-terminal domain-containing protein n=1 Tax=Serpula lacrymans var. lacrymans (strain S7.3) TaxID=936435 RepID=F8QC85_SERL3|nr:hypothetical protein SERLA73DRAFT_188823 [Serpula lacrymans var. lacrymans S7.3]